MDCLTTKIQHALSAAVIATHFTEEEKRKRLQCLFAKIAVSYTHCQVRQSANSRREETNGNCH